jgi:hypothetical protein
MESVVPGKGDASVLLRGAMRDKNALNALTSSCSIMSPRDIEKEDASQEKHP